MNIVKELRLKAGLQQQELAGKVGVSKPTVSDWEHQRKNPRGANLKKLAEIFGVDELVILGAIPPAGENAEHPAVPKTLEARIVSFGMDQLPLEDRQKILSILQTLYDNNPDLFKKGDNDDT